MRRTGPLTGPARQTPGRYGVRKGVDRRSQRGGIGSLGTGDDQAEPGMVRCDLAECPHEQREVLASFGFADRQHVGSGREEVAQGQWERARRAQRRDAKGDDGDAPGGQQTGTEMLIDLGAHVAGRHVDVGAPSRARRSTEGNVATTGSAEEGSRTKPMSLTVVSVARRLGPVMKLVACTTSAPVSQWSRRGWSTTRPGGK